MKDETTKARVRTTVSSETRRKLEALAAEKGIPLSTLCEQLIWQGLHATQRHA